MHQWLAAMLGVVVLTGCEFASDPADARLKADLVGSWRFEYKDDFECPVQGTVRLSEDGKFFGMKMVKEEDAPEEAKLSGLWYVTAGLFKLNTQVADGQADAARLERVVDLRQRLAAHQVAVDNGAAVQHHARHWL